MEYRIFKSTINNASPVFINCASNFRAAMLSLYREIRSVADVKNGDKYSIDYMKRNIPISVFEIRLTTEKIEHLRSVDYAAIEESADRMHCAYIRLNCCSSFKKVSTDLTA